MMTLTKTNALQFSSAFNGSGTTSASKFRNNQLNMFMTCGRL